MHPHNEAIAEMVGGKEMHFQVGKIVMCVVRNEHKWDLYLYNIDIGFNAWAFELKKSF